MSLENIMLLLIGFGVGVAVTGLILGSLLAWLCYEDPESPNNENSY